jgi:Zn-dependent protease
MLRRLGIASGAPLFIPGFGAVVMLKQHVTDPATDARIGLAGPRWGLGAALGALGAFLVTRQATWLAIGQVTGFINLFNLLPVWQLDGARGFHALDRRQRWAVVAAMAVAFAVSGQRLVLVLMAVAIYRAWQRDAGPGDRHAFATFVVLVLSLSLIARGL